MKYIIPKVTKQGQKLDFIGNNMPAECPAHLKFKILNQELNFRLLFSAFMCAYMRNWFLLLFFNFLSYSLRKIPIPLLPRGSFWIYSCLQTAKHYDFF